MRCRRLIVGTGQALVILISAVLVAPRDLAIEKCHEVDEMNGRASSTTDEEEEKSVDPDDDLYLERDSPEDMVEFTVDEKPEEEEEEDVTEDCNLCKHCEFCDPCEICKTGCRQCLERNNGGIVTSLDVEYDLAETESDNSTETEVPR